MDCNIIQDLIPLYIDDCCSEESASIVKSHMDSCPECRALYDKMNAQPEIDPAISMPAKLNRLNDWKASVLQSVLLFVSFAVITVGVALEASTPSGSGNGYWAFSLVIPATGFMLSLANWYFVRLYKSRRSFSNCSLAATLGITVFAYVAAAFHYDLNVFDFAGMLHGIHFSDFLAMTIPFDVGILITAILCVLSKGLSDRYAKMLGKE